ncbi:DET1 homolog isoform X2 [Ornithorhynchus anatinus]|uniref:DET1 homolog isoform X2 n=1 Tax=Ornithorhynchus anatinus TaxID=9258 RepID=UPI0010A945E7|nr:DET1 homolog isoform X2 [Ornithorhynchus anatinus]
MCAKQHSAEGRGRGRRGSSVWEGLLEEGGDAAMTDRAFPTLRPRRIQNQNVIHRLERRRISSGRAGSHWHQVRVFHQNVFPNFTVVNVEKPPCFLRKFSPDGRYFIAFSSDQTSLEIYEYQGCQAAEDLLRGHEGEVLAGGGDQPPAQQPPPQQQQAAAALRGRLFERFFVLLHITSVAAHGEHLNRECSLFTDDCRCVIVGSAAYLPEEPHPPFFEVYRNSEAVTPNPRSPLEDYSLHIVDLHTGRLCDTRTFKCDKVILSHNQGLYLYGNILAVLSVQQQTIHVFQVTPEGTFLDVRTIGRFCYEDDLLTLSAVYPEVRRDGQAGMAGPYKEPAINSLKHRLLVYLWRRAERDGSAVAKRRFFQYFDQLRQLRMWKMQLLDENHLLIKYTSEDVVTLRVTDPSQPSFFVVYNMVTTEVIAVFENTSDELLELFENFCDLFRNATLHSEAVQFPCSASSNNFARQIQRRVGLLTAPSDRAPRPSPRRFQVQGHYRERQVRRAHGGGPPPAGAAPHQRPVVQRQPLPRPLALQLRRQVGVGHGAAQDLRRPPHQVLCPGLRSAQI